MKPVLAAILLAVLILQPAAAQGPWVYCVAGAGILRDPGAADRCVPPKSPDDTPEPFPEGDNR
jgi:hypothetical protein